MCLVRLCILVCRISDVPSLDSLLVVDGGALGVSLILASFLVHIVPVSLCPNALQDNVPGIQQSAAMALGRLASYSEDLAEAVVSGEILPQLVYSLSEQNVCDLPPQTHTHTHSLSLSLTIPHRLTHACMHGCACTDMQSLQPNLVAHILLPLA